MPPTLTRADQVAAGITFQCSLARGAAQGHGGFPGGDVVNFCFSAVEGNESLHTERGPIGAWRQRCSS